MKRIDKFEKNPKGLSAIVASVKHIFYAPIRSFIIILVTSCSLFLGMTSYLFSKNMDSFYESWNKSIEITAYLEKDISQKEVDVLVSELKESKAISSLELITPADGMKMFVENTSLTSLLSNLKDNPLPNVVIIYPKIKKMSKDEMFEFIQIFEDRAEVEVLKADMTWIEQSYHWLGLLDKVSRFFVFVLMLNALFVLCGMSFSMTSVFREKNHLSKIVLQYQFAWYGLISSLIALLLTKICLLILQDVGVFLEGLKTGNVISFIFLSSFISLISSRMASPAKLKR